MGSILLQRSFFVTVRPEAQRKLGTLDSSRARMQVLLYDDSYHLPVEWTVEGIDDCEGICLLPGRREIEKRESKIRNFHLLH